MALKDVPYKTLPEVPNLDELRLMKIMRPGRMHAPIRLQPLLALFKSGGDLHALASMAIVLTGFSTQSFLMPTYLPSPQSEPRSKSIDVQRPSRAAPVHS